VFCGCEWELTALAHKLTLLPSTIGELIVCEINRNGFVGSICIILGMIYSIESNVGVVEVFKVWKFILSFFIWWR